MTIYSQLYQTKKTPQTEKIPGSAQVPNSAGGFSFQADDWQRLDRFLILGTEGGSYYASEKTKTIENAEVVRRCLHADGVKTVARIKEISVAGRAPKNDPAVFALAMCAGLGNVETKAAALAALPEVCRIGTHLFQFVDAVGGFRPGKNQLGGRALKRAVAAWYTAKKAEDLAFQLVKYRQRDGMTHPRVLRQAHPGKTGDGLKDRALRWAARDGKLDAYQVTAKDGAVLRSYPAAASDLPWPIEGYLAMTMALTPADVIAVLAKYPRLPWETVPDLGLGSPDVWAALLPNLPPTALIRNLARMTTSGLLTVGSDAAKIAIAKIVDEAALKKARVHPIAVLAALKTYESGKSVRGSSTWTPVTKIVDALDEAFYLSFGAVEPTGKKLVLGLDVSGSMTMGTVAGVPGLSPLIAEAAMVMVTARVEKDAELMAFSHKLVPLTISPRQRLDDVVKAMSAISMGGTDCSLPVIYAEQNKLKVDGFVTYTDSETWAGEQHMTQVLQRYRNAHGPARSIVVGMEANAFTIADPQDLLSLDVVGFDTAVPNVMSQFLAG